MRYDAATKTFCREISDVAYDFVMTFLTLCFIGFGIVLFRSRHPVLGGLVILPSIIYIGLNIYGWWFVWCLKREMARQQLNRGKM